MFSFCIKSDISLSIIPCSFNLQAFINKLLFLIPFGISFICGVILCLVLLILFIASRLIVAFKSHITTSLLVPKNILSALLHLLSLCWNKSIKLEMILFLVLVSVIVSFIKNTSLYFGLVLL